MSDITKGVSFGGLAYFDEGNFFMFSPDTRVVGATPRFRAHGVAQQMSDGTFDFVPSRRKRSDSTLIMKLSHGRVSKLKNGAIRLTLTIEAEEINRYASIIAGEASLASLASLAECAVDEEQKAEEFTIKKKKKE